ncbi:hypothetical protein S245_058994, partial [Arachis hypogaea]
VRNWGLLEKNENLDNSNLSGHLVTLEETINKLQSENEWEKQNQASLQMRIAQLQSENSSLLEKEVGLEMRIAQLESKKSSLLQNKVHLSSSIAHLNFVLTMEALAATPQKIHKFRNNSSF